LALPLYIAMDYNIIKVIFYFALDNLTAL